MSTATTPDDPMAALRPEIQALAQRLTRREDLTRETASILFLRLGIRPSADRVRQLTQRGSLTDIQKDLDKFWDDIRSRLSLQLDAATGLPEELLQKGGQLIALIWRAAQDQAKQDLAGQWAEADEKVAAMAEQVADMERQVQASVVQIRSAEDAAAASNLAREDAERELAVVRQGLLGAQESSQEWERRAKASEDARQRAEEQFSRDLEVAQEKQARSEDRLQGELRFAMLQIEEARSATRDVKERLQATQADQNIERQQSTMRIQSLRDELGEAKLANGELQGRLVAVTEERDGLRAQVQQFLLTAASVTPAVADTTQDELRKALINHPSAFEVKDLFDAELIFRERDGALQLSLSVAPAGASSPQENISPWFESLEDLDAFCSQHAGTYHDRALSGEPLPERWFTE